MTLLAWISLGLAFASALVIVQDELRHPQRMAIMNIVWPLTALYFSIFAVVAYYRTGRKKARDAGQPQGMSRDMSKISGSNAAPTLTQVAVGTSHCGAGCTVADVCTEFGIATSGLLLFGSVLWTEYLLDFVVAWAVGIAFQYLAIKPMRNDLSAGGAMWAAIKADTLSITAFQVGMYAWMALVFFKFFPAPHLSPFDPRYWLMMQVAMICGFATSFPMNRFLIGRRLKEAM